MHICILLGILYIIYIDYSTGGYRGPKAAHNKTILLTATVASHFLYYNHSYSRLIPNLLIKHNTKQTTLLLTDSIPHSPFHQITVTAVLAYRRHCPEPENQEYGLLTKLFPHNTKNSSTMISIALNDDASLLYFSSPNGSAIPDHCAQAFEYRFLFLAIPFQIVLYDGFDLWYLSEQDV